MSRMLYKCPCHGARLGVDRRSLAGRAYTSSMERPVDAVTSAVLRVQMAQRAVNDTVHEIIERVSADPLRSTSLPDVRERLSARRAEVDRAVDELVAAIARLGEPTDGASGR